MEPIKKDGPFAYGSLLLSDNALIVCLALAKLLIHLATNLAGGYGYFRDELYYIACSDHLAWGYVDHPPLSIAALWLNRLCFGDSLFALRLLPAFAGAAAAALAALMARELGGKRFAQILAACSVIAAPLTLGTNAYFSMNSFDVLFWTWGFYLIIVIMKKDEAKHWILLGFVLGAGLLNKISVLWLGTGLAAGLLLTSGRKLLLTRRAWMAVAIALLLFSPHVVWQALNGFPTVEFVRNATANKYAAISPPTMFVQQAMNMNPLTFPFWFAGLAYFLVAKPVRRFRILPVIYIVVFLILAVNRSSKSEYLGPMFPVLFALGAFSCEKFVLRFNGRWLPSAIIGSLVLSGMVMAPFSLAVLPVEKFIGYMRALGMEPSTPEKKELGKLPQYYADMFGWQEMVAAVAAAYDTLTPVEKAGCAIIGNNYGEAGAVDFFGRKFGLPKAISGHNNYWLWGPRGASGEVVIRLGGTKEAMLESYGDVVQTGWFRNEYCMPYENNLAIFVCRERRTSLKDDWPEFKHYE